jgi:hypothetical protein
MERAAAIKRCEDWIDAKLDEFDAIEAAGGEVEDDARFGVEEAGDYLERLKAEDIQLKREGKGVVGGRSAEAPIVPLPPGPALDFYELPANAHALGQVRDALDQMLALRVHWEAQPALLLGDMIDHYGDLLPHADRQLYHQVFNDLAIAIAGLNVFDADNPDMWDDIQDMRDRITEMGGRRGGISDSERVMMDHSINQQLVTYDPSDPMSLSRLLDDVRAGVRLYNGLVTLTDADRRQMGPQAVALGAAADAFEDAPTDATLRSLLRYWDEFAQRLRSFHVEMEPLPHGRGAGRKLKLLEMFKGTGSVGKQAHKLGMDVLSLDFDPIYTPDIETDILKWDYKKYHKDTGYVPDLIWASPPCNTFSPLAYPLKERNTKTAVPKSARAREGTAILYRTIEIISYFSKLNPKLLFVMENPRGMMRNDKEVQKLPHRDTTLYCLYNDVRYKPTDFFNNIQPDGLELKAPVRPKDHKTIGVVDLPLNKRYEIPAKLARNILTTMMSHYGS